MTSLLGQFREHDASNVRLSRSLLFPSFLAVLAVLSAFGQTPAPDPQNALTLQHDGEIQLEEGRTTLDEQTLTGARKLFADCLALESKNALCAYNLARTESYLQDAKHVQKDKKAAGSWLESAVSNAEHAVTLDDQSSDAHALLGDLYGRKITGAFSGSHYGPKVNAEYERALQLNPKNPRAYLVMGHKFYFAPKMFGGNPDKAIDAFQKATTLDPHYDEAFVWLALAYRKKGRAQDAEKALGEALRLNPRSAFAKRVQAGATE